MKHHFKKLIFLALMLCMTAAVWSGSVTEAKAAGKIPISSAKDFMKIEENPSGSYYLTKDITLPKDMQTLLPYDMLGKAPKFTGTLDGRGHKLKGYTYHGKGNGEYQSVGIFGAAKDATFKNLTLTGVDIRVNSGEDGALVCTLVSNASHCKFYKVKVSGNITVTGKCTSNKGVRYEVNGLAGSAYGSSFTSCASSLKIKVSTKMAHTLLVSGLTESCSETMKNCSFSGSIWAGAKAAYESGVNYKGYIAAGLCKDLSGKVAGCVNSGDITLKVDKGSTDEGGVSNKIGAYGIGGGEAYDMSSCGNSGNIKVYAPKMKTDLRAFGLTEVARGGKGTKKSMTKCWNTGNVSVTGAKIVFAAGLCESTLVIDQCYNKGNVSAKGARTREGDETRVGGLCILLSQMNNCYNVGKVSLDGSGYVGGLASWLDMWDDDVTCNYSTGTVSNTHGNGFAAALFPHYEGVESYMKNKCMVYDNYYSGSKRGCGLADNPDPTVKTNAKSIKISSATSGSCPKLSSKYWTYSSKYKRLILKNNKEK